MWNNWSSCWFISNPPDRLIFFHRMFLPAWHRFSPDVSEGGPFKEYYKEHFPQRQPDIGFCWCKWRRIPPFKEYFPQRQPDIGLWRRKRRRVSVDRNRFSPAAEVGRCPTPAAHHIRIFEYIRIFSAMNIRSYHIHIKISYSSHYAALPWLPPWLPTGWAHGGFPGLLGLIIEGRFLKGIVHNFSIFGQISYFE